MKPTEPLIHLMALQEHAADLSRQVDARLTAESPEQLVPLLQDQVETLKRFQNHLTTFIAEGSSDARSAFQAELQELKTTFQKLVQSSEAHYQKSTQQGIRLTGIGGKPYSPHRS